MRGGIDLVVEDLRFPDCLTGQCINCEHVVVIAGVDDQSIIDGNVAVVASIVPDEGIQIFWYVSAILPLEVSRHRIDRLNNVPSLWHIEHTTIGQRRDLTGSIHQVSRPNHLELADILTVHLIEWTVAPTVECPAPHQPVPTRRVLEHYIRNRNEVTS